MFYKLGELGTVYSGGTPSTKNADFWDGDIPWITPKDLAGYSRKHISRGGRNISEAGLKKSSATIIPKGAVLMSSRAPIGYVAIADNDVTTNQGFKSIFCDESKCLNEYLYYWIKSNLDYIKTKANGSTFKEISGSSFKSLSVNLPDLETQKKIVNILSVLDQKIELNNQINMTSKELLKAIYNHYFCNISEYRRLDEISTVTIGKTPPRSNRECFTKNDSDVKWVSISDLGKAGLYVWDTSEKLTRNAIEQYGVKTIPEDTIILSFKLTIGRTGITTEEMATNEAIAHIIPNDEAIKHYLYCALTLYDYDELGSTSSIANAINSKIVKSMKIGIPDAETISSFNNCTEPLFRFIKNNESQNNTILQLRDALLPKLMSGEININEVTLQ